jgi:hypothetical protein
VDALEELREMHVEAKEAFANIESADASERGGLWRDLQPQLELHERIEEVFVYDPVASEAGSTDSVLASWETEHEDQVREADSVMAQIDALDPAADEWLTQVSMLKETLSQHIAHEESDIWPRIRAAWGPQKLDAAGRAISAAKAAAKSGASISDAITKGHKSV